MVDTNSAKGTASFRLKDYTITIVAFEPETVNFSAWTCELLDD